MSGVTVRIGGRVLAVVPTVAGVVVLTFALTHVLPGDPAVVFAANPAMSAEDIARVRTQLGLDGSLSHQFLTYLRALAQGDLGHSVSTGQPVSAELLRRLPASVELALSGFVIALLVALPMGLRGALRPDGITDHLGRVIAGLSVALPGFVTGLLLIYLFYTLTGLAPEPVGRLGAFTAAPPRITGMMVPDMALAGDGPGLRDALGHLLLPALTMAMFALGPILRMTRTAVAEILQSPCVIAARAHGLPSRRVLWSYVFPNALPPVLTLSALTFCYMLAASVLVEKIFAWPGIGAFALDSLIALDYAPVQGYTLVMAAMFVCVTLLTDILVSLADPRAELG